MQVAKQDELLDENKAADLLDCTTHTLRAWRSRGEGPPVTRIGRKVRYRRSLLDAYIEQHTTTFSLRNGQAA